MTYEVASQLIDARNWDEQKPILLEKMSNAGLVGFDIETFDDPHEGIKEFRGKNKTRVFDINRMYVTGFSIYFDGDDVAYYINLLHADEENRVPWAEAKQLLDAKPGKATWIAHNAQFELTQMWKALDYWLGDNIVCTMQMAVSAYGPDEYPIAKFENAGLGGIKTLLPEAAMAFNMYDPNNLTERQEDLIGKVTAKQSTSNHSYNGFVSDIAFGYGLKSAVKSFLGVQMRTFQETLGNKEHMGQLTGEEVAAYGADDSYYAVALFHKLIAYMQSTNPQVIETFFDQENPMVPVYAKLWGTGMRVREEGIRTGRQREREECARILRELKPLVRDFLPFDNELNEGLYELEGWYQKNAARYRNKIEQWAKQDNCESDYQQVMQISGAVADPWAKETGYTKKLTGPNFTHYMVMRTLIYDLLRERPMKMNGKVQSDGENRGRLLDRFLKRIDEEGDDETTRKKKRIVKLVNELAGVEQRMKLYLTPYTKLVDPDTGRLYPQVTSMLASRRMASENPNAMQLAKRGESTYVRGFFLPDYDDHVLVSIDWSAIELVLIGEFSGDPEFARAYKQLPYQDLHLGAAVDGLQVIIPEVTEDLMNRLHDMSKEEIEAINPMLLRDVNGREMSPGKAKKYWRTEIGKGSNFNYWYSGALSTVGQRLGWTPEQMWRATDNYRERFAVAEEWRKQVIHEGKLHGYVTLPDGHRRWRYEATPKWYNSFVNRFRMTGNYGIEKFGEEVCKRIQKRAGNQLVNSLIQGSCATLAKRSILGVEDEIQSQNFDAVFKMPVHDELVWSVHKDQAIDFISVAKSVMTNHPEIISSLSIDATAAIGANFEPFDPKKAPYGQVEIDEAPAIDGVVPPEYEGHALPPHLAQEVVNYMAGAT